METAHVVSICGAFASMCTKIDTKQSGMGGENEKISTSLWLPEQFCCGAGL